MNISRLVLIAEIDEKARDLEAFSSARDIIRRRVVEVQDSKTSSFLTPLPNWSGTDAVLGSLDLAIHAIERTVEELRESLRVLPDEPYLKPVLTLVKEEA